MANNLPTIRKEKDTKMLLAKTKKLVGIGNKIINNPTKPMIQDISEILRWSDEFGLGLPRTLEELKELKEIDTGIPFGIGAITYIPKTIDILENLTQLYLCENQIKELPDSIGNLTKLTWLYLEGNPDLILTEAQKEWIRELERKGCIVFIDNDLFDRKARLPEINVTIERLPELNIDDDDVPF